MNGRWILTAILPLFLVADASSPAGPGRHADLVEQRQTLLEEARHMELEAPLAATGEAYVVVDPLGNRIDLRIRGRTLRSYRVKGIDVTSPSPRPQWVLTITRVGSGGPVLLPPAPGRPQALLQNDPGDEAGERAITTDEGLLGVEAPAVYTVLTDKAVPLRVGSGEGRNLSRGVAITTDPPTARMLYYSLRPGTRVLLAPSNGSQRPLAAGDRNG